MTVEPSSGLNKAVLELDGDVDNDGNTEHGQFDLVGNVTLSEQVEPDYILSNNLGNINAIFGRLTDIDVTASQRAGIFVDLGGGTHAWDIEFQQWRGAVDGDGNPVRWGNTGDTSTITAGDATGAGPISAMQVFQRYIEAGIHDSFSPAVLYVGEYADGTHGDSAGVYNPVNVAITGPRGSHAAEEYSSFDGVFTAVKLAKLDEALDAQEQKEY